MQSHSQSQPNLNFNIGIQPSLLFSNTMNSREKRNKYLKELFDNYAFEERLNVSNFWKFCDDF